MKPAHSLAKPIRIIQITDFHLLADPSQTMMGINTEQSFLANIEHAWRNNEGVGLFLLTGDLVQDATVPTYRRLRKKLQTYPADFYCLPGNHDDPRLIRQELVDGNIHYQDQVLLDGWQIIFLDSTVYREPGGFLSLAQLKLLEARLATQPKRHAIVCLHHSPLPTGSAWLDTMTVSNSEELFALLDRYPSVKGIVYGHIHQAMDVEYKGLRLLGCPSSCFQFKPNSRDFALDLVPQGYRLIELHPDGKITTQLIRMDSVPQGLDMASNGY